MVGLSRWARIASVVADSLAGCGPSADAPICSDPPTLEVRYPEGLADELIAAATDQAHERLTRFLWPLHGYAFEGRFRTESNGVVRSSADALGLLTIEGEWVHLALSDRADAAWMTLDYYSHVNRDRITTGHPNVFCPADLPLTAAHEPFVLPPTSCEEMGGDEDVELSVDIQPMDAADIDWDDMLFLNDLGIDGRTPGNHRFEPSGHGYTAVDQDSYRSASGDNRLYVDYEAHWRIDLDCPTSHAIVTLDILHAETCDTSGHTHGRYDSACVTIATVAGRPDWASGF
ncbi:MAG: hypothetical protein IAG13_33560 [Deltaproteobacteria bacterium]|nr:hypothetical protein [Nannocystaceae bacterium]